MGPKAPGRPGGNGESFREPGQGLQTIPVNGGQGLNACLKDQDGQAGAAVGGSGRAVCYMSPLKISGVLGVCV